MAPAQPPRASRWMGSDTLENGPPRAWEIEQIDVHAFQSTLTSVMTQLMYKLMGNVRTMGVLIIARLINVHHATPHD